MGGFFMQYGHFDNEKREYVIDRVDLPVSWTNYLGVNDMCAVVNRNRQIMMRPDIKLPQPFASWSNSL